MVAAGTYVGLRSGGAGHPSGPTPSTTRAPTSRRLSAKVRPPRHGDIYWGAFNPAVPFTPGGLAALERQAGRRPAISMWYEAWAGGQGFPATEAARLLRAGVVPMITWEAWRPPRVFGTLVVDQPRYRLARIAAGAFDSFLWRYAAEVRRFGGPVMLRPFHEMDGFWYPWSGTANGNSAHSFVAAWRHVHDVFAKAGATNVTWVWSINALSVPNRPGNLPADYWPGARYVDWIGISGFNWGTSTSYGAWDSFDKIYHDRIASLLRYDKPIALTEIAAAEVGGDKASWIAQTFARLASYPTIGAVVWYDKRDSRLRDWRVESSLGARSAFGRAVAGPHVLSAPAALRAARPRRSS